MTGGFPGAIEWVAKVCETSAKAQLATGKLACASATQHPLPDDSVDALITDPPYYDAVPYAEVSDFFFVWLKRIIGDIHPLLFSRNLTDKTSECIVNLVAETEDGSKKDKRFFEATMYRALVEARRITNPSGVAVVVFAHKTTAGWESQLQAMLDAGWIFTASWPIDTEMETRLRAHNSAALASSVHLVCRPRENPDGSLRNDSVGDWRDVLDELPGRIRTWMLRLKKEGVVGADAIFACLGPALEIFSRYARVEKASGDVVPLREYLEHVWATVSHEAVKMIFDGAEAESLEPDARLTTMWLWTLGGGKADEPARGEGADPAADAGSDGDDEDDDGKAAGKKAAGFALEFDAARMIAQGLGIHLDKSESIVQVKGDTARLLGVEERAPFLFGKAEGARGPDKAPPKKRQQQLALDIAAPPAAEAAPARGDRFGALTLDKPGATVLDRLHQAMLLFGAGRSEALRAFLVEDGAGRDERFWRLADSLSALYPRGSDERRWVEGVSARKKSFGL